jgi:alcohol dehydrogenase
MQRESLMLLEPRRLAWVTEELPPLQPDEALVRTVAGAVSVGTELPQYTGAERVVVPRRYPRMTGYEGVGVVIERGAAAQGLEIGDRVVAFYGHRTLGVLPARKAIKVPDGISDALAVLVILTCDVVKEIRKLALTPEEPALVTGGGAIGLLTLWALRVYGVPVVDVVEPRAERRALALRLGARRAVASAEPLEQALYAAGFECSARDAAFALLQDRMRAGGRICVLADGNVEPLTLAPAFHTKELTVIGSSDGWDYQQHARWYFEQVKGGMPALEALFDEQVTAAELPETFARMARGERTPVKVLVRYEVV